MLPQKRNEPHDEGAAPRAGFEVRVIDGTGDLPAPEPRKGVELGVRIGAGANSGQAASDPESFGEAPVQRLEAENTAEPLRGRPMSEFGPAEPYVSPDVPAERKLTVWTLWMAAGTCLLAVAAVMTLRKKHAPAPEQPIIFAVEKSFGAEKAYFLENTGLLTREAEALLKQYSAATTPEAVLPLVRDASRVKERLQAIWKPMGSVSENQALDVSISESEVRPALFLTGRTAAFTPFTMAFVREEGQLKIDWEASEGIGDFQLGELRKSKTVVKGAKVRVVVEPGNFFTPDYPESDYRSYQLLDNVHDEFVWGFVRKSSPIAGLLEAELNESSLLLEKTTAFPATLRISGPLREGVHLFEITEMLHKGWVSP